MIRRRHRSWFQRTALLAMAALLWSQLALASHGGCLGLPGTPAAAVAAGADTQQRRRHLAALGASQAIGEILLEIPETGLF